jgi:hypothetical protein
MTRLELTIRLLVRGDAPVNRVLIDTSQAVAEALTKQGLVVEKSDVRGRLLDPAERIV